MLVKRPRPAFSRLLFRGGKILLAAELASLAVSYLGWRQLNTNPDLRYYMYKNYNFILEGYYQVGEKLSPDCRVREADLAQWLAEGRQL